MKKLIERFTVLFVVVFPSVVMAVAMPPLPEIPKKENLSILETIFGKWNPEKSSVKKNVWGELGVRYTLGYTQNVTHAGGSDEISWRSKESVPSAGELFASMNIDDNSSVEIAGALKDSIHEMWYMEKSLGKLKIRDYTCTYKYSILDMWIIPYVKVGLEWTDIQGGYTYNGQKMTTYGEGLLPHVAFGAVLPLTSKILLEVNVRTKSNEIQSGGPLSPRGIVEHDGVPQLGAGLSYQF